MTTVTAETVVQAPLKYAYRAFTNATSLREWLCDVATVAPHPRGRMYLWWAGDFYSSGHYLEVEENKLVKFRWLNAQARYGADLMSRIEAAGAGAPLEATIRGQVGGLVAGLLDSAGVAPGRLARIVLVGNTAMYHLFGGLDVAPPAAYPLETPRPDALRWRADELGWPAGTAEVVFLPCLGGFVGSDVLAGLRTIWLDRAGLPAAMFDLGTNGEIVEGTGERLYCASAAAGPPFEGARISCGMRAAAGAISAVGRRVPGPKSVCGRRDFGFFPDRPAAPCLAKRLGVR